MFSHLKQTFVSWSQPLAQCLAQSRVQLLEWVLIVKNLWSTTLFPSTGACPLSLTRISWFVYPGTSTRNGNHSQILWTGRDWIQGIGCLPNSRKNWHCVFWSRSPCLTLTPSPHPQNSTGVKSITQPSLCSCDVATGRSHLGSYCCNCSMALWQLHKLLSYLDPCLPKGTRNSSKSRKMAFLPHFQLTSLVWM